MDDDGVGAEVVQGGVDVVEDVLGWKTSGWFDSLFSIREFLNYDSRELACQHHLS